MSFENDEENIIDLTGISTASKSSLSTPIATAIATATSTAVNENQESSEKNAAATAKNARQRFNEAIRLARQMERSFQYAEVYNRATYQSISSITQSID